MSSGGEVVDRLGVSVQGGREVFRERDSLQSGRGKQLTHRGLVLIELVVGDRRVDRECLVAELGVELARAVPDPHEYVLDIAADNVVARGRYCRRGGCVHTVASIGLRRESAAGPLFLRGSPEQSAAHDQPT